ncbi:hypothetical protein DL93DRAFT_2084794 [Clavulina sp. PMI_390]|nr:hypothetical protein DL93DRAFT_2084794 [Clavulina sp. PMI_390]
MWARSVHATRFVALENSVASTSRARAISRRTLATQVPLPSASSPSALEEDTASTPGASPDTPRTLPYLLQTSLILARAPLLTPTPTPLEQTYHDYHARLQRTLATPFPTEFYFKKGTLLERRFQAEERLREQAAFGEGFDGEEGAERLEDVPSEEDDVTLLSRENEADRKGDVTSLDRKGERSLYLLVKPKGGKDKSWTFPMWNAGLEQPLHKNVQAGVIDSFGANMNTWIVSRQPIGFVDQSDKKPSKTFFFKGRVLGGRPVLLSESSVSDLAWLTREEIAERVDPKYWKQVEELIPRV